MAQQVFGLPTRRVSVISGEPTCNIRAEYQRTGNWRGIAPRKLANGRLLWPALAVLEACGKIPKSLRPTPTDELRDNLCAKAGTDLLQTHKIAARMLCDSATGDTARARFDNLTSDLRDFQHQAESLYRRVGDAMQDEEDGTSDDWRRFNYYSDQIERAVSVILTRLRWRTA